MKLSPPASVKPASFRLTTAFALLMSLAACSSGTTVPTYVVTTPYAMQAQVNGTLAIQDGCLVLVTPIDVTGLAWPEGAKWSDLARSIELGGVRASVGDDVVLGGGEAQWPDDPDPEDWVVVPTVECRATDRYLVVSALVEVSND